MTCKGPGARYLQRARSVIHSCLKGSDRKCFGLISWLVHQWWLILPHQILEGGIILLPGNLFVLFANI